MRTTACTGLALAALVACSPAAKEPVRADALERGRNAGAEAKQEVAPETAPDAIPAPAAMDADVVVSGLTSTMKKVDMVDVGRSVPRTYAGERIGNSPGFAWWVSKHFALKTDRTEAHARLYLELLELAYPHYVEHFGDEPPGIEHTRIPVVYASSWNQAREVMIDDGILRGPNGGGETMYYNKVAYSFPSFYEEHQRYIVIHETAHAFQMCLSGESRLMPVWFTEGIADSLAHHVYDPDAHRLTVMVFDRGPKDYLQHGLDEYAAARKPTFRSISASDHLRRGLNFLMIHYLLDDPSRNARFAVWRDELMARRVHGQAMKKASAELIEQLYGPWDELEREFAAWLATLPEAKTFRVKDEGWEQDGDAFWIRDREAKPRSDLRRIDIAFVPSKKPEPAPWRMDYPFAGTNPLVGRPQRGVDSPVVGALVRYVKDRLERGELGIGLGRDGDDLMTITIEGGRWLVVDGTGIGGKLHRHGLPSAVVQPLQTADDPRLGLRVQIRGDVLAVRVKTSTSASADFHVDLTRELRAKLVDRPMSVVARGADHRIVPFFADGRPDPRIFDEPAPGNRFRDVSIGLARRLAHARWALGDAAPEKLVDGFRTVLAAPVHGSDAAPGAALEDLERVVAAVDAAEEGSKALAALAGLRFRLERTVDGSLAVRLANASARAVEGTVGVKERDAVLATVRVSVAAGSATVVPVDVATTGELSAHATLVWRGRELRVATGAPVLDRAGLELSAHTQRDGDLARVHVDLAGPLAAGAKGKLEIRALGEDPLEVVHQVELEAGKGQAITEALEVPAGTPIQVTAHLDADGEPLKVEAMAEAG